MRMQDCILLCLPAPHTFSLKHLGLNTIEHVCGILERYVRARIHSLHAEEQHPARCHHKDYFINTEMVGENMEGQRRYYLLLIIGLVTLFLYFLQFNVILHCESSMFVDFFIIPFVLCSSQIFLTHTTHLQ